MLAYIRLAVICWLIYLALITMALPCCSAGAALKPCPTCNGRGQCLLTSAWRTWLRRWIS